MPLIYVSYWKSIDPSLFFVHRTLVNNHVFFQHPDLIRILCIHENVIAIMMNSISRASQDQSGEGGDGKEESLTEVRK